MLSFQRKALLESVVAGNISQLFWAIVWLGWQACSDKDEFSFLHRKTAFWCSFKRVMMTVFYLMLIHT